MRILIVEDDHDLSRLLRRRLIGAGYACDKAATMGEALEALRQLPYDLMLLDRRLPDGDGIAAIGRSRGLQPALNIIVVSAIDESEEKVHGFDAGADDYVTKPFNGAELLARIRARLRQKEGVKTLPRLVVGDLALDLDARRAFVGEAPLDLNRREFLLLEAMMRRGDCVVTREELMGQIYGFDRAVSNGALDTLVSRLRKSLAGAEAGVEILLIRGRGYMLTETDG